MTLKTYSFTVGPSGGQFSFDLERLPASSVLEKANTYHTWVNGAGVIEGLDFTWADVRYTALGPNDAVWLGIWRGELNSVVFGRSAFTDGVPWIPFTANCGSSFATEAWCLTAEAEIGRPELNAQFLYHSEIIPAHVEGLVYRVDVPTAWTLLIAALAAYLIWRRK